jgi:Tol biopolymer transport system component
MKTIIFSALVVGLAVAVAWGMASGVASYLDGPQASLASDSGKSAEQHFEKAVSLLKQENFQDAIPQYEKVIQLVPESQIAQDAQYWIGQAYLRMGKYDEALSAFNKLIEKNPGSAIVPVSRLMLTRVQQQKEDSKRKEQIAAAADQSVIIDPKTEARFIKVKTLSGRSDVLEGGEGLSPNGKFLFGVGVLVVPLDGSEPFKLVDMPAARGAWSPDGKKVAFYSDNALWFVPVNPETARASGPPTKLLDTAFEWQTAVSWAPDSERIVFKSYDEKLLGIWILSLKDRKPRLLTDERGFNPRWSPDGKSIAYQLGNQIRLVAAEGGKPETLLDYGSPVRVIAWSPDGKWLRFAAIMEGKGTRLLRLADMYIVALDSPEGVGRFSSWSADGKKLVFFRSSYEYSVALRVVSSSGGPSVQLGRNLELWPYFHFWTRDSRNVITIGRDDAYRIIPLAGGEAVSIKMDAKPDGKPNPISLSPDRKSLLFTVVREDGKEDLFTVPVSLEEARTTGTAVAVMRGWDRNRGRQEFAYSPDGTKLALTHAGNVWLAFPNGGRPVQLTKSSDSPTIPLFSSTGDFIAYVSEDEERNPKLKVVSSSAGDPTTLLDHCGRDAYAWSPDGQKLAAASNGVISVTSIPGGKPEPILDLRREGLEGVADMCWLPNGKRIAFISQRESERGIRSRVYLVPASGGKVTELAADDDGWKDWLFPSPDGRWISYDSEGSVKTRPESSIWEVNLSDLLKEGGASPAPSGASRKN